MTNQFVVELKGISKSYGHTVAADNVSIQINRGEFFGLLGPSGAGKTTLMRLLGGSETPDAGEILIEGNVVNSLPAYRRNVNTVFQNLLLFPHMNVYENVGYGLRMKKRPREEIKAEVDEMLEFMTLSHLAGRKPGTLSGGEQQRVALARAIINKPAVLICDEPLTALDPLLRRQMQSELRRIKEVLGITLIYITHNHEEALSMADRLAVLNNGQVVQIDTPQGIYHKPRTRFVAEFVGKMNVFTGDNYREGDILYTKEGCAVTIPTLATEPGPDRRPLTWGIRPEKISLSIVTPVAPSPVNLLAGVIKSCMFAGPTIEYLVMLDCGKLISVERASSEPYLANGQRVRAAFCASDLIPLDN